MNNVDPLNAQGDFVPQIVGVDNFGHRRNESADLRVVEKESEVLLRKYSGGALSDPPYVAKKKLSLSRNVNLPIRKSSFEMQHTKIDISPVTESPLGETFRSAAEFPTDDSNEVSLKQKEVLTIRIYLSRCVDDEEDETEENVSGVQFVIEGGRLANAELLLRLMANQCKIPADVACEAFALWMVSSQLEVQLKPHHRPYEVRCGWKACLARFAPLETDVIIEEPVLFFRRSVHLSVSREHQIIGSYPECAELLLLDAKTALQSDRLPMEAEAAAHIAGLSFALQYGAFNEKLHNIEFIRKAIEAHLPNSLCKQIRGTMIFGKAFKGSTTNEERLMKAWQLAGSKEKYELEVDILKALSDASSCYGSAYFYGTIERPSISPLKDLGKFFQAVTGGGLSDVEVRVGVNEEFITVFDLEKEEILLVQKIEDCTWRRVDCEIDGDSECESQLLLHFPDEQVSKSGINIGSTTSSTRTNLLQIFGKQVVLVEVLLNTQRSVRERNLDELISPEDAVGELSDSSTSSSPPKSYHSTTSSGSRHSAVSRAASFSKCNKLCLARFENGKCVNARGSLKKVFQPNNSSEQSVC
ncbi:unnamed protein product [Caenorhabditis auriculariae]|uniref:FERM domain-containing protein 8 n=1 Tax=Caenorhabditis auriculariae TaxID=2777116 RepID=A0A8S1H0B4_9PELO|nr:unnamed protein product [Caenorhabditis auriculariae]